MRCSVSWRNPFYDVEFGLVYLGICITWILLKSSGSLIVWIMAIYYICLCRLEWTVDHRVLLLRGWGLCVVRLFLGMPFGDVQS